MLNRCHDTLTTYFTEMATFASLKVSVNPDGWGPVALPEKFVDMPYAPFSKSDRLGRAADFSQPANMQQRVRYRRDEPSGTNTEFQYKFDSMDSDTFSLVDTSKARSAARRPFHMRQNYRQTAFATGRGRNPAQQRAAEKAKPHIGQPTSRIQKLFHNRRVCRPHWSAPRADRKPSVRVQSDWVAVEQFDLAGMRKLQANVPEDEDLLWCGHLQTYDEGYDRLSGRTEKRLQSNENRDFFYVSTTDDPVIEDLAVTGKGRVFATDAVLSLLMTAPRTVIPWDLVVHRVGESLFFDKRDESEFDLVTVSETAQDPPLLDEKDPDNINSPFKLSEEATMINQNYSQQILRPGITEKFKHPNPFFDESDAAEGSGPAAFAYRYRKWDLGDGIDLVARCELHGKVQKRDGAAYMTSYALNEWDSKSSGGIEWREKIGSQRGAVFATELKNNSAKVSRWAAQTVLSGADVMNVGYVSRVARTDRTTHSVLASQFFKPHDLAQQITLNTNNMWGIIKMLVDKFMALPEATYVLMRDPNKPSMHIYRVPEGAEEEVEEKK